MSHFGKTMEKRRKWKWKVCGKNGQWKKEGKWIKVHAHGFSAN